MPSVDHYESGMRHFLMGNEAIARGALEAGMQYAAGYPGTPSSEIIERLAGAVDRRNIYVEWSTNEKAAAEGAGAAAIAGLRSLATMKNAGLSVALDFLTHLAYTGLGEMGGAMVTVVCDDPDGHSSGDETDSRWLSKFASTPLLEASTVQEARDMVKWAFDLSEKFRINVMFRGYTRLCHASSTVQMGALATFDRSASPDASRSITPYLAKLKHALLLSTLEEISKEFETSDFNRYTGPKKPELLIICGGSGLLCSQEALEILGLEGKVGILKIGTLWPFPARKIEAYAKEVDKILIAEEVDPYLEIHVKEALSDAGLAGIEIYGKGSGHIPKHGEITPDRVLLALARLFDITYRSRKPEYQKTLSEATNELLITRGLTWCAGCPHRASFWALEKTVKSDGKGVYVTGDIGCYTLDVFPEGKGQMNLLHAMGSGTGLASGFGHLQQFDSTQRVIAICGDSTFFHASIPALINAVYNGSKMVQIVLDNSATAMTGFQSHPGTGFNAAGQEAPKVDMEALCVSIGCKVAVGDPFDVRGTIKTIRKLLNKEDGVHVLILRRSCEIVRMKSEKTKPFAVKILNEKCKGDECAVCSSAFRCPALYQDSITGKTKIRTALCSGCGVCVDICPFNAIEKEEIS